MNIYRFTWAECHQHLIVYNDFILNKVSKESSCLWLLVFSSVSFFFIFFILFIYCVCAFFYIRCWWSDMHSVLSQAKHLNAISFLSKSMFMLMRARLLPSCRILHSNNQICEIVNLCIYYCRLQTVHCRRHTQCKTYHAPRIWLLDLLMKLQIENPLKATETIHWKQWILCCKN